MPDANASKVWIAFWLHHHSVHGVYVFSFEPSEEDVRNHIATLDEKSLPGHPGNTGETCQEANCNGGLIDIEKMEVINREEALKES